MKASDLVDEAQASAEFQEWLDVQSRLHEYSHRNTLLIKQQCLEATKVAGYRTWQGEFERHVQEGESAIWIWVPIITTRCPECENTPSYHDTSGCEYDETPPEEWGQGLVGFKSAPVFDVSMYLTTGAAQRDELETDAVRKATRRAPANLTPATPRWAQTESLVSASPIGVDKFDESLNAKTPMLAGAVGAMFPFVSGSFAEPGVEYGTYALNESPLILDRFNRETGYCTMVIGQLGAGKSFLTKLQLLRRAMYDPEMLIVMLDPMEGFAGVNEALGGERITVSGRRGFNPLELQSTPQHVLDRVPDLDPWSEQIS